MNTERLLGGVLPCSVLSVRALKKFVQKFDVKIHRQTDKSFRIYPLRSYWVRSYTISNIIFDVFSYYTYEINS